MGIYLSTPNTDIEVEEGSCQNLDFAVADMQGWRKNMEDAHITMVDINHANSDKSSSKEMMSLFGVFDGHGGKEVAKFVRIKYPELFVNLPSFASGKFEEALKESFHTVDELLEDHQYDRLLKELRALPNPSDYSEGGEHGPTNERRAIDAMLQEQRSGLSSDAESSSIGEKNKSSISTAEAVDLIRSILNSKTRAAATNKPPPSPTDHLEPTSHPPRASDDLDIGSKVKLNIGGEYKASLETPEGMQCNLKDHRVMAGCTAIVSFLIGGTLYTANAGDSRGVLCRKDGVAHPLSYDHKPQQEREASRIQKAGGFVNAVGRINGNLNLSRSLGDLKYKQNPHISKAEQMITAEPDVSVTKIEPTDRFFFLACDGIWDCLTCQEACDLISEKLDAGLTPKEIVTQICQQCLAEEDPRHCAGVGGDNMTCVLVVLNSEGIIASSTSSGH